MVAHSTVLRPLKSSHSRGHNTLQTLRTVLARTDA